MKIIGCDLHARQQTVAMLDTTTGEVVKMALTHEGDNVREFYSSLTRPVRVGIEATGSMQWFVNLIEELGIECRVGHPAEIRSALPEESLRARFSRIEYSQPAVRTPTGASPSPFATSSWNSSNQL
jgi:hypothetical protein